MGRGEVMARGEVMSQAKILIVEDERIEAEAMAAVLHGMGYTVAGIAATGKAAIELAAAHSPDVVLMDIRLKGPMDGISAAEEIRRRMDIPVVYLTAFADEKTLERAKLSTPLGYLLKPAQGSEMRSAIEVALVIHEQTRRLTASEASYRGLFDGVPIGLFRTTLHGRILDANLALVHLLGYPDRQTLLNTPVTATYANASDRQRLADALAAGGGNAQVEMPLLRYDGRVVWVNARIIAAAGHPQAEERYSGSIEDITGRRQSQLELEAIAAVATALRGAVKRDDTLAIVLEQLLKVFQSQGAAVATRGQREDGLTIALGAGEWANLTGADLPFRSGATQAVLEDGAAYAEGDLSVEAGRAPQPDAAGQPSGACVPLRAEGQTIGALWLRRAPATGAVQLLTPSDIRLLGSIADMAASAIRRAGLLEKTEQSLRHVAALHAIDQAISGSLDLQVTLDVLLDQAMGELGVDAADVLLIHPGSQQLRQAAGRGFHGSEFRSTSLRMGEGCAGQAALERRILPWPNGSRPPQLAARDEALHREGFTSGYCAPIMAKGTLTGVLEVLCRGAVRSDQDWLGFLEDLTRQAAIAIDSIRLFEDLQRSNLDLAVAYDSTLEGWSKAMDLRDRDTQRVTSLATDLARAFAVPESELSHFRRGALLHDIGKIGVPDSVLLKPGPLNAEEWAVMRQHPVLAYDMLSRIAYLKPALDIPYGHHEKWDGSGYPQGLKGDHIPLAARIFAVVDVWDALTSDRPYRPAWTGERAQAHIAQQSGIHFDPRVVAAFLSLLKSSGMVIAH
jgi:PAS domain S-box-containing protein